MIKIGRLVLKHSSLRGRSRGRSLVFKRKSQGLFFHTNVDFYFYEYLSNMYKRGFIEMHFNWCELMNDNFFGAPMRQGKLSGPCPYPPGAYNLYNMSIDIRVIPRSFPFTKGRIYANVSYKHIFIGAGYIDMEVKEVNLKGRKKTFKLLSLP
ncbi:hypothetical protein ABMA28_001892 [Loxostege sticticalis]|uniref:Uncharacterized protein n=1 Tax=Loxostege sticticalis TaxID=481309 RepID=A0ABD0SZ22_LOXSC